LVVATDTLGLQFEQFPDPVIAEPRLGSNGELMSTPVTAKARPTRFVEDESENVMVKVPEDEAIAYQQTTFSVVVLTARCVQISPVAEMERVPVFVAYSQA